MKLNYSKLIFLGLILTFIGGWLGHAIYIKDATANRGTQVRENSPQYKFINPLLYTNDTGAPNQELAALHDQFQKRIASAVSNNEAQRVGVYFRDLSSGAWTGVNADDKFAPGSILKVATLLTYMKLGEDNPDILNQYYYYDKNKNINQNYKPDDQLESGNYPAVTLLQHMIIESDNAAYLALTTPIQNSLTEFYKTLHLQNVTSPLADFRSPRDISVIFRTVYNSAYLSDYNSEQALNLLSKTTFNKGIVAGIPEGIVIAHKFGERDIHTLDPSKADKRELHDCGIVYYPKDKPYLICIMTQGTNFTNLEKVISDLSKIAYNYVESRQ